MAGTLAVISQSGKSLSFFDVTSGERTAQMSDLIAEPHELCFDSKRNLLYLSHAYRHGHFWVHGDCSHEISVIDPVKKEVIYTIDVRPVLSPHGLVIDKQRDILYTSFEEDVNGGTGGIIGIDLNTRKVIKRISSETKSHWFVMTHDGKKAFTCNKTAAFISILDLENDRMIGKISVPGGVEEPAISIDGRFAFFPTPSMQFGQQPEDPKVLVIDTTTNEIVKTVPLDLGADSVHVTSQGKIMVGKYQFGKEGRLALYDPESYALLGETEIGLLPLTLRSTFDGATGFVANIGAGTVSVVDLSSMKVLKTLEVDTEPTTGGALQGAHGMAHFPMKL